MGVRIGYRSGTVLRRVCAGGDLGVRKEWRATRAQARGVRGEEGQSFQGRGGLRGVGKEGHTLGHAQSVATTLPLALSLAVTYLVPPALHCNALRCMNRCPCSAALRRQEANKMQENDSMLEDEE